MEEDPKDLSHISLDETKDYFFGIRHGQRADKDGEHYDDVPLTEHGKEQAAAAGKLLSELFARSKITKITFIASPFLRTLQTANEVAKECGLKDLKIDLEFMESLYPEFNESNPLVKLESRNLSAEDMQEKYLDSGITVQYPTEEEWKQADEVFPEPIGEDFKRLFNGFENVISKYPSEGKEGSNVVILVGHGSMLKCITDFIEESDKVVDYCSIGALEYDREGNKSLLINRFCGHVTRDEGWKLDPVLHACVI
ncbi:unnamed protein product [Moneuplotes crassus]|uniref:Phosphoglycerate mutase n=1 Tax=Euplotes crassus TaxID=5936 RepID=A0AAD1XTY0_EUPCR|nr:unnamed protein product [Moneuplotes crassus]